MTPSDANSAEAIEAADLAAQFEGFSATPYQDPAGVWTIGYGSTRDAADRPVTSATPPVTPSGAKALLRRDLLAAMGVVEANVKVSLTLTQRVALDDFVYNVGAGNFEASTLLRLLNSGDYAGAAAQFCRWDIAGGKVLAGLLRRRETEEAYFATPNPLPLPPTPPSA